MRRSLLVVGLLLVPLHAGATVARYASLGELVAQSSAVAHATVVERAVVPERGARGEIYTRSVLQVRRYLKGEGPSTLVVQQLGGTLDGLTLRVEGNAPLEPGAEVVAFLDFDRGVGPEPGLAYVVAMAQGVYVVDRTVSPPVVRRDLSHVAFYADGAVALAPPEAAHPTLRALLDAIVRAGVAAPEGSGTVRP